MQTQRGALCTILVAAFIASLVISPLMGQAPIEAYDRLAYRLVEQATDGVHVVPVGIRVPADIGSDVALELRPLKMGEVAPDGIGWQVYIAPEGVAYEVTVQALLDDLDGDRTVMHVAGYDTLPLGKLSDLYHPPSSLPPVRLELDRTRWSLGHRVSVVLRLRRAGVEGSELLVVTWRVAAEQLGLHFRLSSSLIFSRLVNGSLEAERWQPNVMAQANWYHNARNPGPLGGFWKWLGAGAGVHLASLDHGPETVEFGIGTNIALWNGLMSFGYGHNLAIDEEPEYIFVGINLFDVLNR